MTSFPAMRPTQKKGLKINYISIDEIPEILIEKRKTEAAYVNISSPILTAADLVHFEKRIGGLNRAATILNGSYTLIENCIFDKKEIMKHTDIKNSFHHLIDEIDNEGLFELSPLSFPL